MLARSTSGHRLLHIDSAYTLRNVRARGNVGYFLARDASGLFKQVWSVHPIADVADGAKRGIEVNRLSGAHAVVEGAAELCRMPRLLKPLNLLISQFALYRLLVRLVREQSIDVIVAVDPFVCGLLGLAVARTTRRPLVLRISGNHDDVYEAARALAHPRIIPWYRLQKAIGRFVLKRADLVAAINRNNLNYAVANGATHKTAIIPVSASVERVHRVDPADRAPCSDLLEEWHLPLAEPLLLYFGRLIDLKHPDDAIRAMADVIGRKPSVRGVIAGSGAMEPALKELAAELGAGASINFVGSLDQAALSRLIPHCVVLSPSAGQLAVLESALGGAPIVAYDRDFQPEFIDDGIDGYIVPFRDWRAMAHRAEELVANPLLFKTVSGNIRRKAVSFLDPVRVRAAEWRAFAQVLDLDHKDLASE
jgi:glycosyltransferase involved in cell wall biosynthesis